MELSSQGNKWKIVYCTQYFRYSIDPMNACDFPNRRFPRKSALSPVHFVIPRPSSCKRTTRGRRPRIRTSFRSSWFPRPITVKEAPFASIVETMRDEREFHKLLLWLLWLLPRSSRLKHFPRRRCTVWTRATQAEKGKGGTRTTSHFHQTWLEGRPAIKFSFFR